MADILFTTLRLLVLSFATSSAALDTGAVKNHDMQKTEVENEEFRRSYQFADGSHLEVSNANGHGHGRSSDYPLRARPR
jgi:hypothetical protein